MGTDGRIIRECGGAATHPIDNVTFSPTRTRLTGVNKRRRSTGRWRGGDMPLPRLAKRVTFVGLELTFEMQRGDLCHYLVSHLKGNLYKRVGIQNERPRQRNDGGMSKIDGGNPCVGRLDPRSCHAQE